jgi:hypothetical protein
MTLSTLAIIIGAVYSALQLFALFKPKAFTRAARAFPRNETAGFILMGLGTVWFLYNLNAEAIADFAAYKKWMLTGFGALGLLSCIYVRDYLAVRGLSVVMLLLAWVTLNHTRWADSNWRLVLVVWAYTWVIAGMWWTVSPFRLRDILTWLTANEQRIRFGSMLQLALGVLVLVLGVTAFRQ